MTDQHTEDITREIEQYAAERAKQDQIVETRPGRSGETYIPNTPWRRQDNSPHPVPELDSSGRPWRITGRGLHVGSHNGEDYCLEWLPTELLPVEPAMPPEKPVPSRVPWLRSRRTCGASAMPAGGATRKPSAGPVPGLALTWTSPSSARTPATTTRVLRPCK